jgi:uncharacterized LabA/DUF88 family protein
MFKQYIKGNILVLIDAANLESSLKDLGWRMDYKKLYAYFNNNSKLIRITYYSAKFNNEGHNSFLTVLKRTGFKLVTKNLKTIFNGEYNISKANFDVEIALDAINLIDCYDTLVLFSGDSDFDYLIKNLRAINKKVIVVSTRQHVSNELVTCCNKYIDIKKLEVIFQRINCTK